MGAMKVWSIKFTGIYPVGSAAIVITYDAGTEAQAVDLFKTFWSDAYPNSDPGEVTATVLDCPPGAVHILADGNY